MAYEFTASSSEHFSKEMDAHLRAMSTVQVIKMLPDRAIWPPHGSNAAQ